MPYKVKKYEFLSKKSPKIVIFHFLRAPWLQSNSQFCIQYAKSGSWQHPVADITYFQSPP